MASIQQLFTRAHQALYIRSDGRIGHRLIGVPTLLLRTKGRRSGTTRTVAITYTRDGGDYVVVASNWGGDRPPAWQLNIEADPRVEIQVGHKRTAATARVIGRADADFARLWKLANDGNRGSYDRYQAGTSRSIPVVLFRPDAQPPA
jgi:F420H(2)-dependent quinone reductase